MSWQFGVTLLVVVAAGAYLVRSWLRTWQTARGKACSGGCGCSSSKPAVSAGTFVEVDQLRLKQRSGERG